VCIQFYRKTQKLIIDKGYINQGQNHLKVKIKLSKIRPTVFVVTWYGCVGGCGIRLGGNNMKTGKLPFWKCVKC
jgi:hypothetical protein